MDVKSTPDSKSLYASDEEDEELRDPDAEDEDEGDEGDEIIDAEEDIEGEAEDPEGESEGESEDTEVKVSQSKPSIKLVTKPSLAPISSTVTNLVKPTIAALPALLGQDSKVSTSVKTIRPNVAKYTMGEALDDMSLEDLLIKGSNESEDDFKVRKEITTKANLLLKPSDAVVVGFMLINKLKTGTVYSIPVELALKEIDQRLIANKI